jgi:hypothetical protein
MPQGHATGARSVQKGEEGEEGGRAPKAALHGLGRRGSVAKNYRREVSPDIGETSLQVPRSLLVRHLGIEALDDMPGEDHEKSDPGCEGDEQPGEHGHGDLNTLGGSLETICSSTRARVHVQVSRGGASG